MKFCRANPYWQKSILAQTLDSRIDLVWFAHSFGLLFHGQRAMRCSQVRRGILALAVAGEGVFAVAAVYGAVEGFC